MDLVLATVLIFLSLATTVVESFIPKIPIDKVQGVRTKTTFLSSTVDVKGDGKDGTIEESSWKYQQDNYLSTNSILMKTPFGQEIMVNKDAVINISIITGVAMLVLWDLLGIDSSLSRGWTVSETVLRIPSDAWTEYSHMLSVFPIQTKACTSASVYAIGDVIAQRAEGSTLGGVDRFRVIRSLLAGLIGHGPLSHFWYNFCDSVFDNMLHWTDWWAFIPKVVVDQTAWGPIWNNTYILLLGLMKRDGPRGIFGDMKRTTIPLVLSGLKLWPLAHCVTYGLIPVENRLLWVDAVEIIWVTILAQHAAAGDNKITNNNINDDTEL